MVELNRIYAIMKCVGYAVDNNYIKNDLNKENTEEDIEENYYVIAYHPKNFFQQNGEPIFVKQFNNF